MQKLSFLVLASLVVAAGCEGCAFPFETTSTGTIRLSLHTPGADCTGSGTEPDDNGTPDDPSDDSTVTWRHVPNSDVCQLGSDWSGVLVAMANVRESVNDSVEEAGLDPATVQVRINTITPTIDSVTLIDDVSGPDDPDITAALASVITGYEACVGMDGDGCMLDQETSGVLRVTTDGGTVQAPVTTVVDATALSDAANASINDGVNVSGEGHASAYATMASDGAVPPTFTVPSTLSDLENPTLLVTITFQVNGDAIVGGPPAE
ncbi:MAG: hypothetical protein HYS27_23870 [Deltaproteobacteria bacterium]|nr:hypothetical protein [Deltaproteobacteria bacterium]